MRPSTAFLSLAAAASLSAGDAPTRPNVLFIVADDLGWSDVGWHGGFGKTPHLDALVASGIELDRHYVQPVCTPTRAALLTGRYPGRFGRHVLAPSNRRAFPPGTLTTASALKSLGYTTWQTGKWHLGSRAEWGPCKYGFDSNYGTLTGAADPWTHLYRKGPYLDTWNRDGGLFHEEGNATELVAAEALRRIEAGTQKPWFGYVAFHAVHTPVDTPPEYKRLYEGVRYSDDAKKQDSRLRMAAMVAQLDAKVGALVAALERSGQRKNTLIIFTSDNGGVTSLKNVYEGTVDDSPLNSDNKPLRGEKNTLYEGGIRVCAFANWPGTLAPRKHTGPLHAVDWLPTIAAVAGFTPPADVRWDGVNQWPVLSGRSPTDTARPIYVAHASGRVLIQGDWKLIAGNKGKDQLFNLALDPYENKNLAAQETARIEALKTLLAAQQSLDVAKLPEDLAHTPE